MPSIHPDAVGRQEEEVRPRRRQRQEEDQDGERRLDPRLLQEQPIRQVEGEEQASADAGMLCTLGGSVCQRTLAGTYSVLVHNIPSKGSLQRWSFSQPEVEGF